MPFSEAIRCLSILLSCSLFIDAASAQSDRLTGFASRLLRAEKAIDVRKPARGAGEAGGDLLFGIRAEARLQDAIHRYETIEKSGGWPTITHTNFIRKGDRDARVPLIRQRLMMSEDLPAAQATSGDQIDSALHDAIIRFQIRHGLPSEGNVGRLTIAAMNVSSNVRLTQLRKNLARTEGMRQLIGARRAVVVNIPAFELHAMDGDRVTLSSRVVVGRRDRKTPSISAQILAVNLLPTWRVPPGITARDMLPKLRSDPGYFARENFRVVRASDNQTIDPLTVDWSQPTAPKVRFEQAPGANNALGLVRIDMPNKHVVYLHDTPLRQLFENPSRPYSSGCVRVQKIAELAIWLLADQQKWNAKSMTEKISAGRATTIQIGIPVPVHFVYLTSWVEPDGDVNFREDIYKLDGASPLAAKYINRILPAQPVTP